MIELSENLLSGNRQLLHFPESLFLLFFKMPDSFIALLLLTNATFSSKYYKTGWVRKTKKRANCKTN